MCNSLKKSNRNQAFPTVKKRKAKVNLMSPWTVIMMNVAKLEYLRWKYKQKACNCYKINTKLKAFKQKYKKMKKNAKI